METKRNIMPLDVARKQGWRVLAGGFSAAELELAEEMMRYIEKQGGRVALVDGTRSYDNAEKVDIWRPSSEMEYIYETERRLKKLKLDQ